MAADHSGGEGAYRGIHSGAAGKKAGGRIPAHHCSVVHDRGCMNRWQLLVLILIMLAADHCGGQGAHRAIRSGAAEKHLGG